MECELYERKKKQKNDSHDVLLHLPANQLQDPYPRRLPLCLECGSWRCAADMFWTPCMATCLARISFSQIDAVCVVLVVVWRSYGVRLSQRGVSIVYLRESALLVVQDAIVRYLLVGLSEP